MGDRTIYGGSGAGGGGLPEEMTGAIALRSSTLSDFDGGANMPFNGIPYDSDSFWDADFDLFEVPTGLGGLYRVEAFLDISASGAMNGAEFGIAVTSTAWDLDPIYFVAQPWLTQSATRWMARVSVANHLAEGAILGLTGFWDPYRPTTTLDIFTNSYFAIWKIGGGEDMG